MTIDAPAPATARSRGPGLRGLALLATLVALSAPRPATAGMISTASLEQVSAVSSHVGLFDWDPSKARFRVVRWLRGTWPDDHVTVWGLSRYVADHLGRVGAPDSTPRPAAASRKPTLTGRVLLLLEELDGRLYHTGMRRYGGVGSAHAAARFVAAGGSIWALRQIINPGGPMLTRDDVTSEAELVEHVQRLLVEHPYAPPGPARPGVAPPHREAFFAALGEAPIDWYQGGWRAELPGWSSSVGTAAQIAAAATALATWAKSVPEAARLAGLDALLLLARRIQGPGPDVGPALRAAHELLPSLDAAAARRWIVDELESGGYYANRVALARLAKDLGDEAYEAALRVLEGWVERTEVNEGTACFWALRELGHPDRADAAAARRAAREARDAAAPK
ncbi:MAG: hypothetical protein JNM10_05055 [Planctomycetia bacterium]|nr:hypothetical protein [Planctomycetia bacterium]